MKLLAMIPARMGSKRIPRKNIRYIDGKPLLLRAIELAQQSGAFSEVWVTSSDTILRDITEQFKARFHPRPEHLSTDAATNREFTEDFLLLILATMSSCSTRPLPHYVLKQSEPFASSWLGVSMTRFCPPFLNRLKPSISTSR